MLIHFKSNQINYSGLGIRYNINTVMIWKYLVRNTTRSNNKKWQQILITRIQNLKLKYTKARHLWLGHCVRVLNYTIRTTDTYIVCIADDVFFLCSSSSSSSYTYYSSCLFVFAEHFNAEWHSLPHWNNVKMPIICLYCSLSEIQLIRMRMKSNGMLIEMKWNNEIIKFSLVFCYAMNKLIQPLFRIQLFFCCCLTHTWTSCPSVNWHVWILFFPALEILFTFVCSPVYSFLESHNFSIPFK